MDPVTIMMRRQQHRWNDERIAANPNNYNVWQIADVPYIDDGSEYHIMDIYSPDDSRAKLPVIIEIHGGGYISCFKEVNRQHGQYFASKGFHVVNMNYTLSPEADFRTTIREVFTVIDWIKEHAGEYGFDTERLFILGDSAGGHIALCAAAAAVQEETAKYFGACRPSVMPAGYALICPAADIREVLGQKFIYVILKLPLIRQFIDREYMRRISYHYLVEGGLPHMFIQTTPTDPQVYRNTRDLHEAMDAAGIDHIYKEYIGRGRDLGHVFSVIFPDCEESIEANDDLIEYFRSC